MKRITFAYHNACQISDVEIQKNEERISPEIERITAAWGAGYATDYASLSLPSDTVMRDRVKQCARDMQSFSPAALVVIGIGGSNLGARAVYEALSGAQKNSMPVLWADTVDSRMMQQICAQVESILKSEQSVILAIISKSGSTAETIANASILIALIERYKNQNAHKYIVVITDESSKLQSIAVQSGYACLTMPVRVGGRYSIFSAAGLFPLAMVGIDIDQLCAGAEYAKQQCTSRDLTKNISATSAIILYELYQKGVRVHDLFLFEHALFQLGLWYRQLMGESIGKAHDRHGNKVEIGILPTVSMGSTDLHSVGQLYLSGPRIIATTFVTVSSQPYVRLPEQAITNLVPHIAGKSLQTIMDAIVHGTQRAYQGDARPFCTITIPELSPFYCGVLMQSAMVQIMYLGFLFDINPFDQPHVEFYKKETREILAHE